MKKYSSIYVKAYNVKDIVSLLLRKIGIICACAIVFAIGMVILQYEESEIIENKVDVEAFTDEEITEVEECVEKVVAYEQKVLELEDSIAYHLNPYSVDIHQTQYYVEAENEFEAYNIFLALIKYVDGGVLAKDIADATEYSTQLGVHELIRVDYSGCTGENVGTVFKIKVYGTDKETAGMLKSAIDTALTEYAEMLDDVIGENELNIIGSNIYNVYDSDLLNWQNDKKAVLTENENSLTVVYNALSNQQKQYVSEQVKQLHESSQFAEADLDINVVTGSDTLSILKSLILGAAVGILVAIMFYVFVYIFGTTMNADSEILDNYDVLYLGGVNFTKKNKWENLVEQIVEGKNVLDKESSIVRITNCLDGICKRKDIKVIAFVLDEVCAADELFSNISEKLKGFGIEAIAFDNVYTALGNHRNIVFVKGKGKSKCKNIVNEFNVCAAQEADVLGYIVVK